MVVCATYQGDLPLKNAMVVQNGLVVTKRPQEQSISPGMGDTGIGQVKQENMRQHTLSMALQPYRKIAIIINMLVNSVIVLSIK